MNSYFASPSSLWLCLRLTQLPLLALPHDSESACTVLEQQRVYHYNNAARALGVTASMRLASVRALSEHITLLERDATQEDTYLQTLQTRAYRFSPTVCRYQQNSLLIEIGSCLRLAGGLTPLLKSLHHSCDDSAYPANWGLAETPNAAWILSHSEAELLDQRPLNDRLAPLPINVLSPLFSKQVDALHKAGFNTLGAVFKSSFSTLAKRCGKTFSQWLQDALENPLPPSEPYRPPSVFKETVTFDYEVKNQTPVQWAMHQLLTQFCEFLRHTQQYSAAIVWQFRSSNTHNADVNVRSHRPHSQHSHWYQLSCLQLDKLQIPSGIESLTLSCNDLHSLHLENEDLFQNSHGKEVVEHLLDRFTNRLGKDAISWLSWRDEHLPELAQALHPERHFSKALLPTGENRPFWLLSAPQPLRVETKGLYYRQEKQYLQCVSPAERLEDHWWHQASSRDYYTAIGGNGHSYWVFYERRQQQWYLQGIFE